MFVDDATLAAAPEPIRRRYEAATGADRERWGRALLSTVQQRSHVKPPQPKPIATAPPDDRVVFSTFLNSFSGFGRFGMHVGKALESSGVGVAYQPTDTDERYAPVDPWLRSRTEAAPPEQWRLSMQYLGRGAPTVPHVLYTMHETSRLHDDHVKACNAAAGVVVPSTWGERTFRESGVTRPIRVVPLGYDPTEGWAPREKPSDVFRVVMVGMLAAGGIRKNFPMGIRAFLDAFPTERDVELIVKVWPSCLHHLHELPMDGRIRVRAESMPVGELAALVGSAHVYLNPSSGEGWGLPMLEAMACGVAPIATAATAHADMIDDSCAFIVPHATEPAGGPYEGMGDWCPPTHAGLVEALREAYDLRGSTAAKGRAAAARAAGFTWAETGRKLADALRDFGMLSRPGIDATRTLWRRIRACTHRDECGCTKWTCRHRGERVGKDECAGCPILPE